jgi:hypothetical protein
LKSLQSNAASDLAYAVDAYKGYLGTKNRAWLDQYGERGNKLQQLATVAGQAFGNPELAKRSDMVALKDYFSAREQVRAVLKQRGTSLASDAAIREAWEAYTGALVESNIGFEQTWNRVLDADNLTQEVLLG